MGLCRLLPEFDGLVYLALVVAIIGIAAYLVFLITIDVPMYLSRWQDGLTLPGKALGPLEGLRDASIRWVVTHDFAQWKDEIAWISLYFTAAVWPGLALCLMYAHLAPSWASRRWHARPAPCRCLSDRIERPLASDPRLSSTSLHQLGHSAIRSARVEPRR